MIKQLIIDNFLTIRHINIEFSNLNAIVGESGAGKSIILKAIDNVFSIKSDTSVIGNFNSRCTIKILFKLNETQRSYLEEFNIFDDEILIEKIFLSGKTRNFVNHEPISVRTLNNIRDILIGIISQDYKFEVFNPDKIMDILDLMINSSVKKEYLDLYKEFEHLQNDLNSIKEKKVLIENEHPEIVLDTIKNANPKRNEYEELINELNKIKSLTAIRNDTEELIKILYEDTFNLYDNMIKLLAILKRVSSKYNWFEELQEIASNFYDFISGHKNELYNLLEEKIYNKEIDKIESRLFELETLQRKFAKGINEILDDMTILSNKIKELDDLKYEVKSLENTLAAKKSHLELLSRRLSNERKIVANSVVKDILKNLDRMKIKNSIVNFNFKDATISERGKDSINILFSANPDLMVSDIKKIASGGERSRFILALIKSLYKHFSLSQTLILDEIESGIGVVTLNGIMETIIEISKKNQIILITHTKHLASLADKIIKIDKEFDGIKTESKAACIKKDELNIIYG